MMPFAALLALLLTATGSLAASLSPLADYTAGSGDAAMLETGDLAVSLTAGPAAGVAAMAAADPLLDGPVVTPTAIGMPLVPSPLSDQWAGYVLPAGPLPVDSPARLRDQVKGATASATATRPGSTTAAVQPPCPRIAE